MVQELSGQELSRQPPPEAAAASARPGDHLRITQAEREGAEARVRGAVDSGAIDLEEYGQRYGRLLEARTRGDLRQVVHDLPEPFPTDEDQPQRRPPAEARPRPPLQEGRRWHVAVLGDNEVRGDWRPTTETTALAVMGSARIDLREALAPGDDIVVDAVAVMGDVEVIVPPGTDVQMSGMAVMGERTLESEHHAVATEQRVRLRATAVMGQVTVRRCPLEGAASRPGARARRLVRADSGPRWGRLAGALAAVAVAAGLVVGASTLPAGVAVFGSSTVHVSSRQLEEGPVTVDAYTLMGSTTVVVPDGTQVEMGGISVFGSSDCEACGLPLDSDASVVKVRGLRLFGSLDVETPTTLR